MEKTAIFVENQNDLEELYGLFKEGHMLDPQIYDGKPLRLEHAVIYHLVKYEDDAPQPLTEQKIVSIKSVSIDEADDLIKQGYEIKDTFAKTVTLIKKESKTDTQEEKTEETKCENA